MRSIRFFIPRGLAALAVGALAALSAAAPWDGSPPALADPSSVQWELTFDPASFGPGDHPDTTAEIWLDTTPPYADEAFFDLASTLFSGLTPAPGIAITDGAGTGTLSFSVESNLDLTLAALSNVAATGQPPACGTGQTLETAPSSPVKLYDADLNTGADADVNGLGHGIVSEEDLDNDGKRETEEDNFGAGGTGPANGLYDGVDLFPDALANYLIPGIGYGAPIARSFGVATIYEPLGVTVDVNVLVFDVGGGEYMSVTILGYPGVPSQEPSYLNLLDQTLALCPPFNSELTLFGVTQDNYSNCCGGPTNPGIAGGQIYRTAKEGTFSYEALISGGDNFDGDDAAAPYDSCPDTVSTDTDLPPAGSVDPDSDGWDSSCDQDPGSADNDGDTVVGGQEDGHYNQPFTGTFPLDPDNCNQSYITSGGGWDCDQDLDGDTTLNTVDNCPTTPDADIDNADEDDDPQTGIDWQLDSDADTVGDVCDPSPLIKGDGSGYDTDPHPHGFGLPGELTGYTDHDWVCNDEFTVPGTEGTLDASCVVTVDSGNDGDPDFYDKNDDTLYEIGEPIDADGDADGDGYSDGCEAISNTDPLDPSSRPPTVPPGGDCDADGASDDDEEVLGSSLGVLDSDGDGCADGEETGENENLGGWRDPQNPWDFFDVPRPVGDPGTGTKDKQVDGNDALAVLSKFGASPGDPIPAAPKYDEAYDRGHPTPNPWNTQAPDGVQDGNDAIWALWQFGHSCVPPP